MEKLEIPMEAAVLCKLKTMKRPFKQREIDSESKGSNKIQKTKHACIAEAHESTRQRLEPTQKIMKITLRRKGSIRLITTNLVHKFVLKRQAMKIPDAKAAVDTEWKEARKSCQRGN